MTSMVKSKKVCTGLVIVGAILALLGIAVYVLASNILVTVLLLIVAVCLVMPAVAVLRLISQYSFNYMIQYKNKHRDDENE